MAIEPREPGTPMPYWEQPPRMQAVPEEWEAPEREIREKEYQLDSQNWKQPALPENNPMPNSDRERMGENNPMPDADWDRTRENNPMPDADWDRTGENNPMPDSGRDRMGENNPMPDVDWGTMPEMPRRMGMAEKETMEMPRWAMAMAYVPRQEWGKLYQEAIGLRRGTIFPDLDKPFIGEGVGRT